jgi:hypothetical protein
MGLCCWVVARGRARIEGASPRRRVTLLLSNATGRRTQHLCQLVEPEFDSDGNGTIDSEEFTSMLVKLGVAPQLNE